jgi:hypothetical protein
LLKNVSAVMKGGVATAIRCSRGGRGGSHCAPPDAVDAAQARWRAVNAPHLVALVRAGAVFHKGKLLERPVDIMPTEPGESTETEVA